MSRVFVGFGQHYYADVHALLEHHVGAAHGSLHPCRVAVVEHGDVGSEPLDEAYLLLCQGGA